VRESSTGTIIPQTFTVSASLGLAPKLKLLQLNDGPTYFTKVGFLNNISDTINRLRKSIIAHILRFHIGIIHYFCSIVQGIHHKANSRLNTKDGVIYCD